MICLTRRYRFSASHRLHAPELSEERNREVYGKCNNPYGHGHDYVLDVTVAGEVDPGSGVLMKVEDLDALVRERVLADFQLRNMNTDIPEFSALVPTSENVARVVLKKLECEWRSHWPKLEKVRIQETPRNIFEVYSE